MASGDAPDARRCGGQGNTPDYAGGKISIDLKALIFDKNL